MEAKTARLLSSAVSRRAFLAGTAAIAVSGPMSSRGFSQMLTHAFLHIAGRSVAESYIDTYAINSHQCEHVGSTAIDDFAAYAAHPALPLIYVARDCAQWEHLPRGVIETYALECSSRPLRLIAQTPMSLSATGPRSIAVSNCGRYLLASASTGGAWNAFVLGKDGVPASSAIARKETGISERDASLPRPHALAFSPRELYAIGTDPGCERMTLLQPSADGVAVLWRCEAAGIGNSTPVWTSDGRYVVAAGADPPSLSIYNLRQTMESQTSAGSGVVSTIKTKTRIAALLAHPAEPVVFTSRPDGQGSRLAIWAVRGNQSGIEKDAWIPHCVLAIAEHAGNLWLTSTDCVIRMSTRDLSSIESWKLPRPLSAARAIVTVSSSA